MGEHQWAQASRSASLAFLGYEFRGDHHSPRRKILLILDAVLRQKTRRGWSAYFQLSSLRNVFSDLDGWLRMRLRGILRKRIGLRGRARRISGIMATKFQIGDHVAWNSEAGRVSGKIIKVHTKDIAWKGYTHHATAEDPQYEIQSDKTDHVALHKGSALRKAGDREA